MVDPVLQPPGCDQYGSVSQAHLHQRDQRAGSLYVDPYLVGAMIMSMEANDDEMALRLQDKGIAANPDEWILAFNAGFLCYDRLKDYPRAVHYFELAVESPGCPAS